MVAEAEAKAGPIDILVNNAGITRDRMFAKMEKDQWDAVISTNLTSLFNMTKQVSAKMAERGWGRIINISSVNGVKGQAGQTNYSAAKAGVIGFTKALAQELATKGVTVNAIAPGYVATKMVMAIREDVLKSIVDTIPMKRLAKPEEMGAPVLLPGLRSGRLHDRRHAEHQRRPALAVSRELCGDETPAAAGVSSYNCCAATAMWPEEAHMAEQLRLIKKYPNRRLYDTRTSTYITLVDVKELVLQARGVSGRRRQDRRGPDAQHPAADHPRRRSGGAPMFSSDLLAQMIRFYGNAMQGMMGKYLENNIKAFTDMQKKLQEQAKHLYGDNAVDEQGALGAVPQLPGAGDAEHDGRLRRAERKMFQQMQDSMQEQTRKLFSGFQFPGYLRPASRPRTRPAKRSSCA